MISLLSKIIKFNKLCVIGIFNSDSGKLYYTLHIRKKGDKLNILSTAVYDTLEDLFAAIDIKVPVILNFDGKGILTRRVQNNNEADVNWLNNIDFKTIYFSRINAADNVFISLCRKNLVDETMQGFNSRGLHIIDFSIGPLLAVLLHETLNTSQIISNDVVLEFNNKHLAEIHKAAEVPVRSYSIGNTTLSQYHLPLYGLAINFFINHQDVQKNTSDGINNEELVYKEAFQKFGIGMLAFFFISLLASYLLLQYYGRQNMELNQKNVFSNQTYDLILQLEKQKEQKLSILNETGQLSKNFLSYYVYELSRSVPNNLNLNGVDVFPVVKEVKANEKVTLNSGHILVLGSTLEESSFDAWLAKLKKMPWIKKFEINSLKKDKKNVLQFEIKILLNHV